MSLSKKLEYAVNAAKLSPLLCDRFLKSSRDASTSDFLASCTPSAAKDAFATVLKTTMFYSTTDANALADRGKMFVLSRAWRQACLGERRFKRGIDIGAGDGGVTLTVSDMADSMDVTEASSKMRARLKKRFADVFEDIPSDRKYDLVLLLNVLDRCDDPIQLLTTIRDDVLEDEDSLFVLAVVLPFCPMVESNAKKLPPTVQLPISGGFCKDGASFERSASLLTTNVLSEMGFEVVNWTRLPYLCEGEARGVKCYVLDDAVFVLKKKRD